MGAGGARQDEGQLVRAGAAAGATSTPEPAVPWTEETPLARLGRSGTAALSMTDLLVLLLAPSRVRKRAAALPLPLLARSLSLAQLAQAGVPELVHECGLPPAQAAAVVAARELGRRLHGAPAARRPVVRTPADVAALVGSDLRHLDREHFRVVLLTTRHTVLAVEEIAVGGLDSAIIHPREVFKPAIRWSAAAVVLVHNHPSGDPEPSVDDVRMTTRLAEAGQILGVEVLDHVVVGDGRYVSLRERGLFSSPVTGAPK